jgi:hypothetical protein
MPAGETAAVGAAGDKTGVGANVRLGAEVKVIAVGGVSLEVEPGSDPGD